MKNPRLRLSCKTEVQAEVVIFRKIVGFVWTWLYNVIHQLGKL